MVLLVTPGSARTCCASSQNRVSRALAPALFTAVSPGFVNGDVYTQMLADGGEVAGDGGRLGVGMAVGLAVLFDPGVGVVGRQHHKPVVNSCMAGLRVVGE
jgi:hypothetical protein